jgi:hypothetical protein
MRCRIVGGFWTSYLLDEVQEEPAQYSQATEEYGNAQTYVGYGYRVCFLIG